MVNVRVSGDSLSILQTFSASQSTYLLSPSNVLQSTEYPSTTSELDIMTCGDLFLGLLAIIFPPIAVWVKRGLCSADSLINILLCCLGFIPGLLHAWYIIAKYPETEYDYEQVPDSEGGQQRVTHYYISHQPGSGGRNYGTQGGQPAPKPKNAPAPQVPDHSRPDVSGPSVGAGGNETGAPPSYSDVVRGDNKVQNHE